jgi:hypothetical protein
MNKLDLLEDKKRRALAHWQLHQQAVEEVRLKLAIVQAQAQRAYEELRSINDMINLIQGRKILAQQRIKIGRTLYTGSTVDVATAKELQSLGINVAGIKSLIRSGELKLQRAATTSCKCN